MDICELAKKTWNLYLMGQREDEIAELIDRMDEEISIIGTGSHEFYQKRSAFMEALGNENPEREMIDFEIQSISAREQPLSDEVKLVAGTLHVVGRGRHANVLVDMDTRYTMVFQRMGESWKVVHVHQSMPYVDQKEGEYYPKTLMEQVDEANRKMERLEWLATVDRLTGLLNHSAFYEKSEKELKEQGRGYCFIIDLDDFKGVNDTYGHHEGDVVLHEMGKILRETVEERGVLGRIGGDEFAVFTREAASGEEACSLAKKILQKADAYAGAGKVFPGVSIGISRIRDGEGLREAFHRADNMLYKVKRSGKQGYRYCD